MISDSQKQQASSLLDKAFDTFKRAEGQKIVVWSHPERSLISSQPTYNFGYPEESNADVSFQNTPVSGEVDATIEYVTLQASQELDFSKVNSRFMSNKGIVRICVNPSGMPLIRDAERIEFDDKTFITVTEAMPRGLFAPNYFDFWLQSSD